MPDDLTPTPALTPVNPPLTPVLITAPATVDPNPHPHQGKFNIHNDQGTDPADYAKLLHHQPLVLKNVSAATPVTPVQPALVSPAPVQSAPVSPASSPVQPALVSPASSPICTPGSPVPSVQPLDHMPPT